MNPVGRIQPLEAKYVKEWEWKQGGAGEVVRNPDLVRLNRPHDWQPIKYVSYLWLLVDQEDLRVGIETQATDRVRKDPTKAVDSRAAGKVPPPGKDRTKRYGHPTMADYQLRALAAGELLYKASVGWVINRDSGRWGVYRRNDPFERSALMEIVKALFKKLANVNVLITTDVTVNQSTK